MMLPQLKEAPDRVISQSLVHDMEKWSIPAKSLEILYSLDISAHFSLASGMVHRMMELAFVDAIANEGTTEEAVSKEAKTKWRDNPSWMKERPSFEGKL